MNMRHIDLTSKAMKSPFRVPENYFENFPAKMMERISDEDIKKDRLTQGFVVKRKEKVTLFTRVKPYLYLAATICGLAFGIKVFKYQQHYYTHSDDVYAAITDEQAAQFVDDVCDITMVNGNDVYSLATDNF